MLPKADGFTVLHAIRQSSQTPVLMLTAMDDESTQIMSFDEQTDDYMSKPFSLAVLEKRIEGLLRRKGPNNINEVWVFEDTKVDFSSYSATYKDMKIDVKPKEINLLKLLIEHLGQVLSRDQILDRL